MIPDTRCGKLFALVTCLAVVFNFDTDDIADAVLLILALPRHEQPAAYYRLIEYMLEVAQAARVSEAAA